MENNEFLKKFLAGVFFVAGLYLVFFVIFTISQEKGLTEKKFKLTILYRDIGGLMEGAQVRLSGVNVGTVGAINFLKEEVDGRRVVVVVNIFAKFKEQLNKNAAFAIKTEGILGQKLIEITLDENGSPFRFDEPIFGQDPLDVQDLAEAFTAAAHSFTKTSEELGSIDVKGISKVVGETAQALEITSQGVNTILKEMDYLSKKSKRILDRLEQKIIEGNLFKVF